MSFNKLLVIFLLIVIIVLKVCIFIDFGGEIGMFVCFNRLIIWLNRVLLI